MRPMDALRFGLLAISRGPRVVAASGCQVRHEPQACGAGDPVGGLGGNFLGGGAGTPAHVVVRTGAAQDTHGTATHGDNGLCLVSLWT